MERKNTAEVQVGRLLEVRAAAGYRTAEDVDVLFEQLGEQLLKVPGKHVTVVDWRACPLMAPEAAERIGYHIKGTNHKTERSAALASHDAPTAVLQFVRVIRDAGLPDRKLFFDPYEIVEWLSEVLTSAELARLKEFLSEAES